MNCISWNCRGLGQPRAVLELTEMVKKYSPSIIFLMETRSKEGFLKKLCSKLHADNVFIVPRTNTGGGLALYWKNSIDLHVMSSSPTYIDAVANPGMDDAWRFTGFYGNPVTANREHSWALLKHLCLKMDLPWMCIGDFNEIVKAKEKMGGALRRERQMREFWEALDFCGFRDLGFVGSPFTWCNNRPDEGVTWIRLDRGVATPEWSQLFPTVRVHHIAGSLSDHCPLWLSSDDENKQFFKRNRPFRFEAAWLKDEGCEAVIKHAWLKHVPGENMEKVMSKIEACSTSLQRWSRLSFGNIRQMLKKKKKQLVQAEALSMRGGSHEQVRILRGEVHDLMVKEDVMWHQRARVEWLKNGDLNTSYFHSRATQRNKKNFISKLVLEDNTVVEDEKMIGEAMVNYFRHIFTSTTPSEFEPILQGIEPKITHGMNADLIRDFTALEVEQALKQMKPLTAPGPDGMSPIFYKSCWNFISQDVIAAALSVLNSGTMPENLNHTFIALIPKTKSPEQAKDFRPISLCNVLYKIISKTIANRLKNS